MRTKKTVREQLADAELSFDDTLREHIRNTIDEVIQEESRKCHAHISRKVGEAMAILSIQAARNVTIERTKNGLTVRIKESFSNEPGLDAVRADDTDD